MKKKLAIITTHPIQYYSPLFKELSNSQNIEAKVFYTWEKDSSLYDKGFKKNFSWDIPLLEGFEYTFVSNNSNPNHSFWDVRNPTLNFEIEQWGAQWILIFGWNYLSHLRAILHFSNRIPIVFRGDSHCLDKTSIFRRKARFLFLKWLYDHVDFLLYTGQHNKEYYLASGQKLSKLIYAPHSIDNKRFIGTGIEKFSDKSIEFRQKLNIKDNEFLFLFVGKFEEKKAPLILLEAFIAANLTNAKLLFVGNGNLAHALKERSKFSDRIMFLDFQNQSIMPIIYRMANCFVLPSKGPNETWGLAVNEAMACSRSIIVSNKVGCNIDLVFDGINGYIFESENLEDLKCKLKLIYQNEEKIEGFGGNSLKIIQNFTFERICSTIETLANKF